MKTVSILGSGTWGTALANLLANNHVDVTLYSKFDDEISNLKTNLKHPNLKNSVLSNKIKFTSDISYACKGDIIVFASPSIFIRSSAIDAKPYLNNKQIIVTVAKGIEKDSLFTMSDILKDVLGDDFNVVALSGPTHAEEVADGLPTLITSASSNLDAAKVVQDTFSNAYFRVYTNDDVLGVELSGALKNIIALASGISTGLGYGDNAKAAIVTRGLAEITRLGLAMGCKAETFSGLTGIGDIVVTATSMHSRNNKCGMYIGQGYSVKDAIDKVGMVVEGINALDAGKQLADKYHVDMPIINGVYDIIRNNKDVKTTVNSLFERSLKSEVR